MLDNFRAISVTWDHSTNTIYNNIRTASEDANGRKLVVQVVNGHQLEDLTSVDLRLYWEFDEHKGFDDFELIDEDNSIYEIHFSTDMVSHVGAHKAWLHLVDAEGTVTSEPFTVTVFEGVDADTIQDSNEFSALSNALVAISDLETNYAPRLNSVENNKADKATVNSEVSRLDQKDADLTAQLAHTGKELEKKPNREETGWASFNTFDEPTRATILGMEPGQVNAVLGYKNVQPENAAFFEQTANLFDKTKAIEGKFVNHTTGELNNNPVYATVQNIRVDGGDSYERKRPNQYYAWKDEEGNFIPTETSATDAVITAPDNAAFLDISVSPLASLDFMMLTKQGNMPEKYVPYREFIPSKYIEEEDNEDELKKDSFGKEYLRSWQAQMAKQSNPDTKQRAEVAIIGDSWVQEAYRLATPLRRLLTTDYADGGIGFVGLQSSHLGNGVSTVTKTGAWTNTNYQYGLDMRATTSSEAGATLKVVTYETSDRLEIHHIQQVGSYRFRINSGEWTEVDCSTSSFVKNGPFTSKNVTLEIEILSSTVTLLNAYFYNGEKGVVVHKIGYSGATTNNYVAVSQESFIHEFQKSNIHTVGILLGTNDMGQDMPLDTYRSNILEMVNRIKTAKPLTDVFLIAGSGNNQSGKRHDMKEYREVLREIANEYKLGFLDLYANIGAFEESFARGLFLSDGVHPNRDGGHVIANLSYDRLLRVK